MMYEIYQNAVLNVSADHGINSRAGCFVERNRVDITPLQIRSIKLSQSWHVLPIAQHLFEWMEKAPSFSRAWIYRERQLARRVLHFTEKELIWECCGVEGTSFASEMFPNGAPFREGLFNLNHKYQTGRLQQGLVEGDEETYATWNDICENLSEKRLTKPSDMPVVISGLAREFARMVPGDEYVAGLWRSTLPYSLVWNPRFYKPDWLEYIAPSWSWLSAAGAVVLPNRSCISAKHPVAQIRNISAQLTCEDPYGPISGGALEVEGFLRRVRFTFNLPEQPPSAICLSVLDHESDNREPEIRVIGTSWNEYEGDLFDLTLDAPLNNDPSNFHKQPILDCHCLFITTRNWGEGMGSDLQCLLLKQDDDNAECGKFGKPDTFTRLGTLYLKVLYALKMRYKIRHDTDREADDAFWDQLRKRVLAAQQKKEKERAKEDDGLYYDASREGPSKISRPDVEQAGNSSLGMVQKLYQFDGPMHEGSFLDWLCLERLSTQIFTLI
jgi:hypothetical protein